VDSTTQNEAEAQNLPTAKAVEQDLQFIDNWRNSRVALRQIVTRLQSEFQVLHQILPRSGLNHPLYKIKHVCPKPF
jgi:hypothetical protein